MDNKSYVITATILADQGREADAAAALASGMSHFAGLLNQVFSVTHSCDYPMLAAAMEMTASVIRQILPPNGEAAIDEVKKGFAAVGVKVLKEKEGGSA